MVMRDNKLLCMFDYIEKTNKGGLSLITNGNIYSVLVGDNLSGSCEGNKLDQITMMISNSKVILLTPIDIVHPDVISSIKVKRSYLRYIIGNNWNESNINIGIWTVSILNLSSLDNMKLSSLISLLNAIKSVDSKDMSMIYYPINYKEGMWVKSKLLSINIDILQKSSDDLLYISNMSRLLSLVDMISILVVFSTMLVKE